MVREKFRSFVSRWDVPYVYGMTCGELAQMINGEHWIAGAAKLSPPTHARGRVTRSAVLGVERLNSFLAELAARDPYLLDAGRQPLWSRLSLGPLVLSKYLPSRDGTERLSRSFQYPPTMGSASSDLRIGPNGKVP